MTLRQKIASIKPLSVGLAIEKTGVDGAGSPRISSERVIHKDPRRQIFEVTADFGEFTKDYVVVDSGEKAGLLAIKDDSVLLVRQYRLLIDGLSWEIPGGMVDVGEDVQKAAVRECLEETGVLCQDLKPLIRYLPGLDTAMNPTQVFYSEHAVETSDLAPNPKEVVERCWTPIDRCIEMVFEGLILDTMSIISLLAFVRRRSGQK